MECAGYYKLTAYPRKCVALTHFCGAKGDTCRRARPFVPCNQQLSEGLAQLPHLSFRQVYSTERLTRVEFTSLRYGMPLYEYECKNCSKQVEILVANLNAKPVCPECGSGKLSKLLSVICSPVVGNSPNSSRSIGKEPSECGRSQCASGGCMFGNS